MPVPAVFEFPRQLQRRLHATQKPMPQAPEYERPARSVPQAGCQKHEQFVRHRAQYPLAVAAQRDIEIIAEPCGQRNVPPPPEVRDAVGTVGIAEVFRQPDTEQQAEADSHIAVAGKIEIEL